MTTNNLKKEVEPTSETFEMFDPDLKDDVTF
jgi:hypothetical protein